MIEPMPALPGGNEALPVRDRQIDRRERACTQDRAGNNDAGGGLLVDNEVGANCKHG